LAKAHVGIPLTIILDNARYQRCTLVQMVADSLGIELLYLPTYSPNLNLIERFWKFVKKQCLYSKYYSDSESFQQSIVTCIEQAPSTHKKAVESVLTLRFQTFHKVPVIGGQHKVSQGSKKKVLSSAA
jgi:transposase